MYGKILDVKVTCAKSWSLYGEVLWRKINSIIILLLITEDSNKDYNQFNMFFMDTYINIKIYDLKSEDKDKVI